MNSCTPSYCVPGSSRNWSHCNMSNWGIGYEKYKITCKDETKCKMQKTKKTQKIGRKSFYRLPNIFSKY